MQFKSKVELEFSQVFALMSASEWMDGWMDNLSLEYVNFEFVYFNSLSRGSDVYPAEQSPSFEFKCRDIRLCEQTFQSEGKAHLKRDKGESRERESK